MGWTEQDHKSKTTLPMTGERAKELEQEKALTLPLIQKESEEVKPFDLMEFQPVRSPGIYEGEFAVKNNDIIFHFWPWGYHAAERDGKTPPRFKDGFEAVLKKEMASLFGTHRVLVERDADIGALFAKARGYGDNQFARDLAIRVMESVHKGLGGES